MIRDTFYTADEIVARDGGNPTPEQRATWDKFQWARANYNDIPNPNYKGRYVPDEELVPYPAILGPLRVKVIEALRGVAASGWIPPNFSLGSCLDSWERRGQRSCCDGCREAYNRDIAPRKPYTGPNRRGGETLSQ